MACSRGAVLLLVAVTSVGAGALKGQRPADAAEVSFHFTQRADAPREGTKQYEFRVHEDGMGSYEATIVAGGETREVKMPLKLTAKTAAEVFAEVRQLKQGGFSCASKAKNIASSGLKTVSYNGPDGTGSCTYDYTERKNALALADTFQKVERTLEDGRALEFKHRYDRLGLDGVMSELYKAVQEGQVLELGTIAPVLQSIAGDVEVLERVRARADALLKMGAS